MSFLMRRDVSPTETIKTDNYDKGTSIKRIEQPRV